MSHLLARSARCVAALGPGRRLRTGLPGAASPAVTANRDGWELCVGLELHAQVKSVTKAFSPAAVVFGAAPNSNVDPLDAGMPGTLPVLSERMVDAGLVTALALGCTVNQRSFFDRKHYFYADMPAGYQITQQRVPLAQSGKVVLGHGADETSVRVERLHLEHDSGKSIHTLSDRYTLVDLNRCGTGLMEIVTKPDIRSGDQAAEFVQQVMLMLRTLGTCDGNMAEGSLRVDANISVRPAHTEGFGTRCEVKNISGLRFLSKAIEYEASRQRAVLEGGRELLPETRGFDPSSGKTVRIRGKEGETDYRYMPEPDLPPLVLSNEDIAATREAMPELPRETVLRLVAEYDGLTPHDAWVLLFEPGGVEYFEAAASGLDTKHHSRLYHWVTSELYGLLHRDSITVAETTVSAERLGGVVQLVGDDAVSGVAGKQILAAMAEGEPGSAEDIATRLGLVQVSDAAALEAFCREVLTANPAELKLYQDSQNPKYIKFFMGQVLRASKGSANPKRVQHLLAKLLDEASK